MEKKIDASIIIVSFGTRRLTLECIESVKKHTKITYKIIVVDNASGDGSATALKKIKGIKVIENKENLGFATANNIGAQAAGGRYILLLNSDTKLTSDAVGHAVAWMEKNKEVGLYSCQLKSTDGSIQQNGGYFPSLGRVFAWMTFLDDIPGFSGLFRPYHPKQSFYNQSHDLDWVTAAFCMVRRGLWDRVGGMDTDYFMYVEDVDLCYKARKHGSKIYYDSDNSIVHYGGASSNAAFARVNEFVGLRLFYKKHFPKWQTGILRFFLKTGAIIRACFFGLVKGREAYTIYNNAYKAA